MMKKNNFLQDFLQPRIILIGIGVALLLLALFIGGIMLLRRPLASAAQTTAVVTILPAPTLTPTLQLPTSLTPGANANQTPMPVAPGEIGVGSYIKIVGTGGDGLRLRADPGKNGTPLFLGMDEEVFEVKDGPREADNLTWWYLVSNYDPNRAGWAASEYLEVVK